MELDARERVISWIDVSHFAKEHQIRSVTIHMLSFSAQAHALHVGTHTSPRQNQLPPIFSIDPLDFSFIYIYIYSILQNYIYHLQFHKTMKNKYIIYIPSQNLQNYRNIYFWKIKEK
jgi:hypothetical protein